MAQTQLIVDVYNFDSSGNFFVNKVQQAIPLPAQFVKATSPDSRVYVYSKIVYEQPKGFPRQAYTAETVAALAARANS